MATPVSTCRIWRFGVYEVDTRRVELRRNGTAIKLREQPFTILIYLLENAGEIVSREELRRVLWPSDTFVDFDHSLSMAVMNLREALGDSSDTPLYVETIPKRGYRFIAPVSTPPQGYEPGSGRMPNSANATPPLEPQPTESRPAQAKAKQALRRVLIASGGVVLLGFASSAIWYLRTPLPPPRITGYAQLTNDGRIKTIAGTDGNRLFANVSEPDEIEQVSLPDGRSGTFRIDALPLGQCGYGLPSIRDVSPGGSLLLVFCPIAVVGGFGNVQQQVWIVGALGQPARFLTNANDAAWSADGKSIAYSTPEGAIYGISSDGGESRLLVPSGAADGTRIPLLDLSWSPDGKLVRFTRERRIWEASANGGHPHPLLPPVKWPSWSCCGRWTPDGAFFLFLYGDELHSGFQYIRAGQLWALDERRGRLRPPNVMPIQLTSGPIRYADTISAPDGKRIYSGGLTLRGELVRYDRSSKQFQLYLGGISAQDLAFSWDGKYVAYVTFPDGILWRANRDGSNVMQLTEPSTSHPTMPSWSPDGTQIMYVRAMPSGQNVAYVVPSSGGSSKPLLSDPTLSSLDANWSPDGKRVVFAFRNFASPYKIKDLSIRVFDLETQKVSILPHSEGTTSPRWSPDNRYIAALSFNSHDLRLFDLKTQKWRLLLKGPPNEYPSWSRDSRYIYTWHGVSEGSGVYRTPIGGGPSELVADLKKSRNTGWFGFWFGLDPTDAPLLLRDAGTYEIYALDLKRD